jgi:hypothetical protein
MSNPNLRQRSIFANGHSIRHLHKLLAETGRECWNRTTGAAFVRLAIACAAY